MKSYNSFADYYDNLTQNVEYIKRADYLCSLVKHFNHNFGLTLDLACGTGSLTLELFKRGIDIYGIDGSEEMLSQAQMKAYDMGLSVLFLCQKMQNIDLYGTIDTCLCTLDSINHLTKPDDVLKTFQKVALFMNKGGLFIFDVNTIYKNKKVLGNNTFVYDTENVFCVWQNTLEENNIVNIELDFFEQEDKMYRRSSESFCERAYSNTQIKRMLKSVGFCIVGMFGDLSFNEPSKNEERIIFVAQKL